MKTFTRQDFDKLARFSDQLCVSILMPTHQAGRETTQDPIRFKNLLNKAEQGLIDHGQDPGDVRKQLKPLRQLMDDNSFWAHQQEGLAVFATPADTHVFGAPFSLPERMIIGPHCYLLPLIPILSEDSRFFVLAISPKCVRLIEGTRYSEREVELPGWPDSLDELAAYIEEEPSLQFHTGAPTMGNRGVRAAMFHGQGVGDTTSDRKQRLLEYCRLIDQRVRDAVGDDRVPLVLACDKRLAPIYREASSYPHILSEAVTGNPDDRPSDGLCRTAWEILEPQVAQRKHSAISRYGEAAGNNRVARRLDAVLAATQDGRVDTLLVAKDALCWGRYDPERQCLDVNNTPNQQDEELVNLAAISSYLQGASLHALSQQEFPEREEALAILRY